MSGTELRVGARTVLSPHPFLEGRYTSRDQRSLKIDLIMAGTNNTGKGKIFR